MCGSWKCSIPPKEVARRPPDDYALRIARGPESVGCSAASCEEAQTGVTAPVRKKLGTVLKAIEERREAKKRRSPVAGCKGEKMPPVGSGVAGPISQRQAHEVGEP